MILQNNKNSVLLTGMKNILFCILLVSLFSCSQVDPEEETQTYYFEIEYENQAWGYQFSGIHIDRDGSVYSYDFSNTDEVWQPTNADTLGVTELENKYSHASEEEGVIAVDSLLYYYNLALNLSDSSHTDPVNEGADMGLVSCSFFIYDEEDAEYYRQTFRVDGDWSYENNSEDGQAIIRWLVRVHDSLEKLTFSYFQLPENE